MTSQPTPPDDNEGYWQNFLNHSGPHTAGRRVFEMIPGSSRCSTCAAPFEGTGTRFLRLLGRGRAHEHAGICSGCVAEVAAHPGGAEIVASVLHARFHGGTDRPDDFGDRAIQVVLDHHGLVDTQSSDVVVAFFVPALCKDAYAGDAIATARDLLEIGRTGAEMSVATSVGVHAGTLRAGMLDGDRLGEITVAGAVVDAAAGMAARAAKSEAVISLTAADAVSLSGVGEPEALTLADGTEVVDVVRISAA